MLFPIIFSVILQSTALVAASVIPPASNGGTNGDDTINQDARGITIASESQYCNDRATELFIANPEANAADAIIATVLCIGTVAMYHSGIGGGGPALVKSGSKFEAIDFRPTAPSSATDEYYNDRDVHTGGAASGVPAELKGLSEIHKYGKLPWKSLFQPAIRAARGDFKANDDTIYFIEHVLADSPLDFTGLDNPACGWLGQYPWNETFCPHGKLMEKGTPLNRTKYATTLDNIANSGSEDIFYSGYIANHTYDTLKRESSLMTLDDLKNYKAIIRNPVSIQYRGYNITSVPIPSSGTVVLSILKILEKFVGSFNPGTDGLSTHWLIEALRFGYAQRSRLGDPAANSTINLAEYQKWLLDEKNGFPHAVNIQNKTHQNPQSYILPYSGNTHITSTLSDDTVKYSGGTSHVVALDHNGLAISLTTSVGEFFGSRIMDPTGIIFDDVMADFQRKNHSDPLEFANNHIEKGGKRPLSGMSPTIVTDKTGNVYFITGSAGGPRIPSATLQTIVNVLDRNMSVGDALSAPRLHDQLSPNITEFDLSLTNDMRMYNKHIVRDMRDRNHHFTWVEPGFSSAQAIRWVPGQAPEASGEEWQSDSGGCVWWDGVKNCPFKPGPN